MKKLGFLGLLLSLASNTWAGFGEPYIGAMAIGWATSNAVTVTTGSQQPVGGGIPWLPAINMVNGGPFATDDGVHHTYDVTGAWMGHDYYPTGLPHPSGRLCGPGVYSQNWISFAFDKPYTITDFDIWNGATCGGIFTSGDFALMDSYIDYKVNGVWQMAATTTRLSRDPTNYVWFAPTDTISVNLDNVTQVVITPTNSWGESYFKPYLEVNAQISEIRFYIYTGNAQIAKFPSPVDGAIRMPTNTKLGWMAGASASSQDVYFGTTFDAVNNAVRLKGDLNGNGKVDFLDFSRFGAQWQLAPSGLTADLNDDGIVDLFDFSTTLAVNWLDTGDGIYKGHSTLNGLSYDPGALEPGKTYYWRIDEVNGANTWKGNVWSFMVQGNTPAASNYYVATDGSDHNDGLSLASPFQTIQKARDTIVNCGGLPAGGVTVFIRGGKYFLGSEMDFTSANSGTPASPIVYRAYTNETPRIIGGVQLDPSWFTVVPNGAPVFGRMPATNYPNVYECNLVAHGITDLGKLRTRGVSYGETFQPGVVSHMELSCDGAMMQLARWPNSGYATIATGSGSPGTTFTYSGTPSHESKWPNATDPWVHGFWNFDFYDQYLPVATFSIANNTVTLDEAPGNPSILAGKRWRACNLLEELDQPQEYYIETAVGNPYYGRLYFWPPGNSVAGKEMIVSTLGEGGTSLIKLAGASNIVFRGLTLEVSRFNAVEMHDCNNVVLDNCTLRNVGNLGVRVEGGSFCGVQNSKVYGLGQGIGLSGGSRYTLEKGNHYARNNEIHDFGRWAKCYQPGIGLYGVGNEASNNEIYDGPHSAILFYQNNHLIQCNKIHDVVKDSSDAGAIYTYWGWDNRGSLVKWNCIYDIIERSGGTGVWGIYIDGYSSGMSLHGNIIDNIHAATTASSYSGGIFLNGGRDNDIYNCVITYVTNGIVAGEPCAYPVNYAADQRTRVSVFNYQNPPWSTAYPALAAIPTTGDISYYAHPGGCTIRNNIEKWNTTWEKVTLYGGQGDPFNTAYCTQTGNMINTDPLYLDRANKFFAPTYGGLARIPYELIGLLDQSQASNPIPRDKSINASKATTILYWAPAFSIASHKVYMGTTSGSLPLVSPIQNYTGYAPPPLSANTTYYWRIDEVDGSGGATTGVEWNFRTGP